MTRLVLGCVLLVAAPRTALAEPPWVPVVVEHPESAQTLDLLRRIAAALHSQHDVQVRDAEGAARMFEVEHSSSPVQLDEDEVRQHADLINEALQASALAQTPEQWKEVFRMARSFSDLPQQVQDYVRHHVKEHSQAILTQCLMGVQHMLNDGRKAAAHEEMVRCIHGSPEEDPDEAFSSVAVRQLHSEVMADLRRSGQAELTVELSGAARKGCRVVVNGRDKSTPLTERRLAIPVRVQVNCEGQGRSHLVKLVPGPNQLVVDPEFERRVRTVGYLALQYDSAKAEADHQQRDALRVAKTLGASELLLATRAPASERITFARVNVQARKIVAAVTVAVGADDDQIVSAARALAMGHSGDIVAEAKPLPGPQPRTDTMRLYGGVALLASGTAALGLAWLQYAGLRTSRDNVVDARGAVEVLVASGDRTALTLAVGELRAELSRVDERAASVATLGILGAAVSSAAMPALMAVPAEGVPLWSWFFGVAGLGVAGGGAVLWMDGQQCSVDACDGTDPALGQLVMLHSAPLIAIPLTHLVQQMLKTRTVSVTATGDSVALRGSF